MTDDQYLLENSVDFIDAVDNLVFSRTVVQFIYLLVRIIFFTGGNV